MIVMGFRRAGSPLSGVKIRMGHRRKCGARRFPKACRREACKEGLMTESLMEQESAQRPKRDLLYD